ncbi:hypothetical protein EH221_00195 [bacterium]|nr:MAG: hypothetical protein EH221_00195 [bacterium]
MPKECVEISAITTNYLPFSISVSKDNKKIAVLSINVDKESPVCIIDVENGYSCWETEKDIRSIDLSPINNEILISKGDYPLERVVLVDEHGKLIKEIGFGISPAWSPNGEKIAYFSYDYKKYKNNMTTDKAMDLFRKAKHGLIVYDLQTQNEKWIYEIKENSDYQLYFGRKLYIYSHISWSGDMQYHCCPKSVEITNNTIKISA